jgi:hypothetical protein
MKSVVWLILVVLIAATGCKKENPANNRYSTWTVDGRPFQTNDVDVTEAKAFCAVGSHGPNRFNVAFMDHTTLPTSGDWPLRYEINPGRYAPASFYVDTSITSAVQN